MAQFDVPLPKAQDPSYLHYSKPIGDIPADTSLGKLFKGIGDAVEEGVKGFTQYAQKTAENTAEDRAQVLTNQYLTTDEDLYQKTFPGQLPSRATDPTNDTLTPKTDANGYDQSKVPQIVTDKLNSVANSKAAREQGGLPGHIRDTQYYADIYKAAQELRSQFPGYRDYIDKGFEKVTGFTPNANAYRKSLLADLNEAYSKKNEVANKVTAQLFENKEFPGVTDGPGSIYGRMQSGALTPDQAMFELSKVVSFKGTAAHAKADMEVNQYNNEQLTEKGRSWMQAYIPGTVNTAITGAFKTVFPTPESIDSAGPDQWRAVGQQLQLAEAKTRASIESDAPKGMKAAMGNNYEEALKPYMTQFELYKKAITDQDIGLAHELENSKKAFESSQEFNAIKNSDWYKAIYINQKLGGQGFQFTVADIANQLGIATPGNPKFTEELRNILTRASTGVLPPNLNNIKQMLGYIKQETKDSPADAATHINQVGAALTSPQVPDAAKAQLTKYTFGPGTEGWLGNIKDDQLGPPDAYGNRQEVKGKHAVFWQYSDPKMVESIRKLGPQVFQNYENWMISTFRRDITGEDIKYLSNLPWIRGMTLTLDTPHNGKDPMKFVALPGGNPGSASEPHYGSTGYGPKDIQFSIGKVNYALAALSHVIGADRTNALFMQTLHESGVDTRTSTGHPQSTLDHLILSVGVAGAPKSDSTKTQEKQPGVFGKDSEGIAGIIPPMSIRQPQGMRQQGTMNQANPDINIFPGQGAPSNAWRLEDSPGYKLGKEVGQRLGNVSADALERYERTVHPNFQAAMDKFSDLFGRK